MGSISEAKLSLARRVLPKGLYSCIEAFFGEGVSGAALVGGTALAGFFAGHRRSDDFDIFVKDATAFQAAVLALKSLVSEGLVLSNETRTAQYYHAGCEFKGHRFTADIVLDANLFKVGAFMHLKNKMCVADLETITRMKVATLVSRCGEKDLYDLQWIFTHYRGLPVKELVEWGQSIDSGVSVNNLLVSLAGTQLREEACGFSLDPKVKASRVFKDINKFKDNLVADLLTYAKNLPPPALSKLVKKVKPVLK